jgi:hypothetical protein
MMGIYEKLKELEHRIERVEMDIDVRMGALRAMAGKWAQTLTDATQNPNINWSEVNRVIDAIRDFARGEVKE